MDMPREHPEPVAIAIFAKAPVAGFAKTRLIRAWAHRALPTCSGD
jgi:hypothetical protein